MPKELIVRKGPPGTGRRMIEEVIFDETHIDTVVGPNKGSQIRDFFPYLSQNSEV